MAKNQKLLTTKAFSEKAGVSAATVSNWLKKGKINGKKEGNRWLIPESELKKTDSAKPAPKKKAAAAKKKPAVKGPKKVLKTSKTGNAPYTVEAFSKMTFLTTFGVEKWLKEGRLTGGVDASGNKCVDAANLENPLVKRLLR